MLTGWGLNPGPHESCVVVVVVGGGGQGVSAIRPKFSQPLSDRKGKEEPHTGPFYGEVMGRRERRWGKRRDRRWTRGRKRQRGQGNGWVQ